MSGDQGDTERKPLSALLVSQLESSDTATRLQRSVENHFTWSDPQPDMLF